MMYHFSFLLVVSLMVSPVLADDVDDILNTSAPHQSVDALPAIERERMISNLADRLENDVARIGPVLCAIAPWTTGSEAADDALQQSAWRLIQLDGNAESTNVRWLDCLAANRMSDFGYRAVALDPMFELRQTACAGGMNVSGLPEALIGIDTFDDLVSSGLAAEEIPDQQAVFSFYPLRNALRRATFLAALAVEAEKEGKGDVAKEHLGSAADILDAVLESLNKENVVEATRNGWRRYDDVEFYSALYRWLSDGTSRERIEAFLQPTPVKEREILARALSDEVRSQMPDDFVDMIYVERLLPGAQGTKSGEECSQWRRRSYAIADLASYVLECPNSSLTSFDSCMMSFEATDWTVVFSTVAANSGTENDMRIGIERFVDRALPKLSVSEATAADLRSRLLQMEIVKANGRVRFSSGATFSTSEREQLQNAFRDTSYRGIEPLFYRPRAY